MIEFNASFNDYLAKTREGKGMQLQALSNKPAEIITDFLLKAQEEREAESDRIPVAAPHPGGAIRPDESTSRHPVYDARKGAITDTFA